LFKLGQFFMWEPAGNERLDEGFAFAFGSEKTALLKDDVKLGRCKGV